jgi:hypothetical protein
MSKLDRLLEAQSVATVACVAVAGGKGEGPAPATVAKVATIAVAGAEKLRAAVTIHAHGEVFVVIPEGESIERWKHKGSVLTVGEVERLISSNRGRQLPPAFVKALAATKRVFPTSVVEAPDSDQG